MSGVKGVASSNLAIPTADSWWEAFHWAVTPRRLEESASVLYGQVERFFWFDGWLVSLQPSLRLLSLLASPAHPAAPGEQMAGSLAAAPSESGDAPCQPARQPSRSSRSTSHAVLPLARSGAATRLSEARCSISSLKAHLDSSCALTNSATRRAGGRMTSSRAAGQTSPCRRPSWRTAR
jgi:hypothetical protein